MSKRPPLSFETMDSKHRVPPLALVGKTFAHADGGLYEVTGFSWNATDDVWMINYGEPGGDVPCSRTFEDFFSTKVVSRFSAI